MKLVQQHIARLEARFQLHPFFARLEATPPLDHIAPFPLCLTFFVMTFQELLRISDERTTSPELKRIVHRHRLEDAGHDRWFLADLATLGIAAPTLVQLFSQPHDAARHASLALASEAFNARNDVCQLTLLMTLESAAHVFFERVSSYLERAGEHHGLRYFHGEHIEAEKSHELFAGETDAQIDSLELDAAVRDDALQVVTRCYREMTLMFDRFEAQIAATTAHIDPAPRKLVRPAPAARQTARALINAVDPQ